MKLLLDQNLAPSLVGAIRIAHPGSNHVREFGLERADDARVWDFAKERGYAIVSKDADFHQMSFLHGHPPKVIWLRLGNCPTDRIQSVILGRSHEIEAFLHDADASFLTLE